MTELHEPAAQALSSPLSPAGPIKSSGLHFIVSTSNVDKADAKTRKIIRSHVMLGKRRKAMPGDDQKQNLGRKATVIRAQEARGRLDQVFDYYTPLTQLPRQVGSDLSFVDFAQELDPSIALNVVKGTVSSVLHYFQSTPTLPRRVHTVAHRKIVTNIATRIMYPLLVILGSKSHSNWPYVMSIDTIALHVAAFALQSFVDRVLYRRPGTTQAAMLHLHMGLRLLRERLQGGDEALKTSDATLAVVLKLAICAHFEGDHCIAREHMHGLRRIVDLRGGLDLIGGSNIHGEMVRYDLDIALLGGSSTIFYRQPSEPVPEYPTQLLPVSQDAMDMDSSSHLGWLGDVNSDLATAWRVMRRFCLLADLGTQPKGSIRADMVHQTMVAVMYRLLHMHYTAAGLDETIRCGLLAFCHHAFLQWQDVIFPYQQFRSMYEERMRTVSGTSPQLRLWLGMVGAVSIYNVEHEGWLQTSLEKNTAMCGVRTWNQLEGVLKKFLWMTLLDGQAGSHVFLLLNLRRPKSCHATAGRPTGP